MSKYQRKELVQHIYDAPDTYVGGSDIIEEKLPVYKDNGIIYESIEYIPAIVSIFNEILVNARDHYIRLKSNSELNQVTTLKIEYDSDTQMWSVYNDGEGIDIALHPTEKDEKNKPLYIPELIFGHPLTSTNYNKDEKKIVGGKNGYGAKLTNIFSTIFNIETVDSTRGLKYKQGFSNNMKNKSKPKITKCKGKPYTKVSWITDFKRFGIESYSDDMLNYMTRRIYDISGITHKSIKVLFNKAVIKSKTFDKYIELYNPGQYVYEEIHSRWQIGISVSNDKFEHISFVNGIFTSKGGKHVDYITKQITTLIKSYVLKKHKNEINESYIKNYLKIFVNSVIENPSFDSQTKERLITTQSKFGSKPIISDKFIKKLIEKTSIIDKIISYADFKDNNEAKKTDGVKRNKINVPKLNDANYAGTKRSEEAILILTEGDSAKTMAISGLSVVGRNNYGIFPLKGKVLNVKEASIKQITDNAEISNIKKILGLETEKVYTDTKSLRYGKIMIMTDQDHDGSHIKGLVINIFHTLWPSLLKLNYIMSMVTPIVKVSLKKEVIPFYNLSDYNKWKVSTPNNNKWNCKYYKGLGTSTSSEAKEYFKNIHKTNYTLDPKTDEKMDLAFKKDKADDRKEWLYNYNENKILDHSLEEVSIEKFIDNELIHFSNSDTFRSIGSVYDGLKPSQRKILYSCFKRKLYSELKVAQLSGYVSENSAYHHGEASLQSTIIGMAQNFVGTNNINLLEPNGQFGTRIMGGSDSASPRYIHTELNKIVDKLYPKKDLPLLSYNEDDGLIVEPKYYVPIIPLVLVNGMKGIGTGFSTTIPQYNPKDIIKFIRSKINGGVVAEIHPWYRGFTGTIVENGDKRYITKGVYDIKENGVIIITELPIGTWTQNYKQFLDNSIIDKKKYNKKQFIIDYEDHTTDDKILFKLKIDKDICNTITHGEKDELDTIEKLCKLYSSLSTSNIHLYNFKNKIQKYNTIYDIIDDYFNIRLELYYKRKQSILQSLQNEIEVFENKMKFIEYVIDDKIIIYKKSKDNIIKSLDKYKFIKIKDSYDYLINMSISQFTIEKINELISTINKLKNEYSELLNKSIQNIWLEELNELDKLI